MSLSHIIDQKEVKEKFKLFSSNIFPPLPLNNISVDIIAPPDEGLDAGQKRLIGSAFHYLIKFFLEYLGKEKSKINGWKESYVYADINDRISRAKRNKRQFLGLDELKESVQYINAYLKSGKLTIGQVKSCIFLARWDWRHKADNSDYKFDNDLVVEDIYNLYETFELDFIDFEIKDYCDLYPELHSSVWANGADPDLIVDGTLIDIKTSAELKVTQDHFNQVLGYYLLSLMDFCSPPRTKRNKSNKSQKIESVELYFPRFSYSWKKSINEIASEKEFEELKDWFQRFIRKLYHQDQGPIYSSFTDKFYYSREEAREEAFIGVLNKLDQEAKRKKKIK